MKSRFELDAASASSPMRLIDPETMGVESAASDCIDTEPYDASEQQFAASLEKSRQGPRFVVEEPVACLDLGAKGSKPDFNNPIEATTASRSQTVADSTLANSADTDGNDVANEDACSPWADTDSWRKEVCERLSKYQARRRPRGPRYPSLQLKFETQEVAWRRPSAETITNPSAPHEATFQMPQPQPPLVETTARVIAFPRSSTTPPSHTEELAEPVFDRPRIMEAPDLPSPAPALGGILIDRIETPANEKRPGFEMPLQSAKMARRLAANVIDGIVALMGLSLFGYVFWLVTAVIPSMRLAAGMIASVGGILWAGYQYLLIIFCGTSPGLKLAKLQLSCFDGSPVSRKVRRWRVVASILSGLSLGLGYAWCLLDEDRLCWHDRITRTYMAPKA
jgi:uncharacterized RDD family membrane protein YckC